jgi:hypothetical protein
MNASPKLLGAAWVVASFALGVLGWLLVAISESDDDRLAGWTLLGVALVGLGTAVALFARGSAVRPVALVASAVAVLGGVAAVLLMRADGNAFTGDLLWVGGVPVVTGLVTGLLALGTAR